MQRILDHSNVDKCTVFSLLRDGTGERVIGNTGVVAFEKAIKKFAGGDDADDDNVGTVESDDESVDVSEQMEQFRRSVVTHNVRAVTRIYSRISLKRLGKVCGIGDESKTLSLVSGMISKGTIGASIDQASGFIEFTGAGTLEQTHLSNAVHKVCHEANELYFEIKDKYHTSK